VSLSVTTYKNNYQLIRKEVSAGTYIAPLVRLGLEWKPRPRIGWTVFGQYNFSKEDYKVYGGPAGSEVLVRQFTFPQIMVETTLSFYF